MLKIQVIHTPPGEPLEIFECGRLRPTAIRTLFRELRARAGEAPGRTPISCYVNDDEIAEIRPEEIESVLLFDDDEDITGEMPKDQ